MKPASVVIKKYPNRRLYDTSSSTYVNLDDIAKLVRNGTDVKISDAETGEDITRVVLTQIIVEDAKGQPTGLPVELLKQLIVAGDHVGREFIMWYLRSAFDAYQKMQGAFQSGLAGMRDVASSPVDTLRNFLRGPEMSETEQLKRRIADLEAKLESAAAAKKSRKPRARRPKATGIKP